jgi:hypothetical protein
VKVEEGVEEEDVSVASNSPKNWYQISCSLLHDFHHKRAAAINENQ